MKLSLEKRLLLQDSLIGRIDKIDSSEWTKSKSLNAQAAAHIGNCLPARVYLLNFDGFTRTYVIMPNGKASRLADMSDDLLWIACQSEVTICHVDAEYVANLMYNENRSGLISTLDLRDGFESDLLTSSNGQFEGYVVCIPKDKKDFLKMQAYPDINGMREFSIVGLLIGVAYQHIRILISDSEPHIQDVGQTSEVPEVSEMESIDILAKHREPVVQHLTKLNAFINAAIERGYFKETTADHVRMNVRGDRAIARELHRLYSATVTNVAPGGLIQNSDYWSYGMYYINETAVVLAKVMHGVTTFTEVDLEDISAPDDVGVSSSIYGIDVEHSDAAINARVQHLSYRTSFARNPDNLGSTKIFFNSSIGADVLVVTITDAAVISKIIADNYVIDKCYGLPGEYIFTSGKNGELYLFYKLR